MSQQPTPGPWEVRRGRGDNLAIYLQGTAHNVCAGVNEGDATLIMLAPDLKAALKRLLLCPNLNLDDLEPESVDAIKEALRLVAILEAT